MLIQYQNTFEEFCEAASAAYAEERKRRKKSSLPKICGALFVAYFLLAVWLWGFTGASPGMIWIHLLIPVATIILVAIVFGIVAMRRRPTWRTLAGVFVLIASCTWLWFSGIGRTIAAKSPSQSVVWQILLPHSTWIFLTASLLFLAVFDRRGRLRRQWELHPAMARAITADISGQGISLSSAFSKSEFQWQGLQKWQETKNLFMLYTGTGAYMLIPKRAFESAEHLEAMRSLVKLIQSPGPAFPVLPVTSQNNSSGTSAGS